MNANATSLVPTHRASAESGPARPARRLRRAVLAGLTALTVAGGLASAAPAQAATHTLDCLITGGIAYTGCSGQLTVHPGQRVDVDLVSSGGKKVRFCVEPFGGGWDLGCSGWVHPGANTALVWHNTTGQTHRVQLIAGKNVSVTVHAKGQYHVR
ncbi:hypothetical protein ACF053_01470 [Streptomyces kanasensis]|uniref:hypothetical protein n=1 Tax=Streptomyces kanasensis TaxID=936756 RepID=UPI0036F82883